MRTTHDTSNGFTQHQLAQRRGAGFTLIEFTVVFAIIGILIAMAVPALNRSVDLSRAAQTIGQTGNTEVVRAAEHAGLSQVAVIDHGIATSRDPWYHICRADNDFAYEVDGTDRQERRVRITMCCRLMADAVKCAIPLPVGPFPWDR